MLQHRVKTGLVLVADGYSCECKLSLKSVFIHAYIEDAVVEEAVAQVWIHSNFSTV